MASLAVAHSGIVFLLLSLRLLPGSRNSPGGCLQNRQPQILLLQTDTDFSDLMVRS